MKHYQGNFHKDCPGKEKWVVGHFMGDLRKTENMEVKFWKFKKGKPPHKPKHQKEAVEFTIITRGKISGQIDGKRVSFRAGDYVLIPPGIKSNFPSNVLENAAGITVKAPSVEGDTVRKEQQQRVAHEKRRTRRRTET